MNSNKVRDNRRSKLLKMPRNMQRLYKENKCKDCTVVVTQMDFAKILGKFTKVKIQYESSTPKTKKNIQPAPAPNSRLKKNENGMVLIHRNAYNQHPVKGLLESSKSKATATRRTASKENNISTPHKPNNILKENNKLKKTNKANASNHNKMTVKSAFKLYGIVFDDPKTNNINDYHGKFSLAELLPFISKDILPSEEWCIDYFPKDEEPKDDKVYDRIAAELEDLMYKEKPSEKVNSIETKTDDFPSIMDILNDNTSEKPNNPSTNSIDFKSSLESSDVEAMLLGKPEENNVTASTPMEVDNPDMNTLIADVAQLENNKSLDSSIDANPNSPSILEEALQKGIEEHLPINTPQTEDKVVEDKVVEDKVVQDCSVVNTCDANESKDVNITSSLQTKNPVTHVIFKKSLNGKCLKSVTCPKSLKYTIELQGKSVEFLGAPKFITNIEDLQVLLQIVDESNLDSLYVLH